MLPGVGIFGSDSISKVLIQLLRHFEFEIHGIWTNHYEIDHSFMTSELTASEFPKLITTSIDNVLLNKNVNLIFVCCQPNLHSQICSKALGIGKNVICLSPTCKDLESITSMINSARYYPSLMSSINYGGLRFLSEFKLIKQNLSQIGDVKLCNIVINCQNIALLRQQQQQKQQNENQNSKSNQNGSLTNLIDNIAYVASASTSPMSLNWLSDKDLGAGVLNRFGASIISLLLHLFDDKKVTKVYGCLKTFVDEFDSEESTVSSSARHNSLDRTIKSDYTTNSKTNSPVPTFNKTTQHSRSHLRHITADDYCTFQMRLESAKHDLNTRKANNKNTIMVTVVINSLASCKYSQNIIISGSEGAIEWSNSSLTLRSKSHNQNHHHLDDNNNQTDDYSTSFMETELRSTDPLDESAEAYLKQFKNLELIYPELPLIYIKGLYYYLSNVKNSFEKEHHSANSSISSSSGSKFINKLDNFEHTQLVQSIIKSINLSSDSNRWVSVNY